MKTGGRASGTRVGVAALLAGAALLAAAGPAAAQRVSFEEAVALLAGRNERLQAADAAVARAAAERRQAWGRHLPDVAVSARSTRIDEPIAIDLDGIRRAMLGLHPQVPAAAIPPFVTEVQGRVFSSATLTATVPVFAGGRLLAGDRAAAAALASARAQRGRVLGELMTELVQRYFGLQLARESRRTRERTRETLAQHVERARSLERNGQVARAERLRAEVALAEAERELRQAQRDESLAEFALSSTLSLDGGADPVTVLTGVPVLPPLDSLQRVARERNPSLQQLAAERTRARQGVRAAAGELAPSVGLFATRELYTKDLTLLQPEWAVGVAVSVPLFQGGQRLARVSAARAQERELDLRQARAERDVALLVERRHAELDEAMSRLTSLEATHALAAESLRAQQSAFTAGLATSLDVLDAEQALARVDLGIQKARYDAVVSMAGLLEALGSSERLPEWIRRAVEADR